MILKNSQLTTFIQNELKSLEQLVVLAEQRLSSARKQPKDADAFIESAALHLQAFYTAAEQILSRIAENVDESVPVSSAWHADLLRQMTYDVPGRRPAVIRQQTHDLLDELRGFRHRVRNLYTFNLNPNRVAMLVDTLPHTFQALSRDLKDFTQFLDSLHTV